MVAPSLVAAGPLASPRPGPANPTAPTSPLIDRRHPCPRGSPAPGPRGPAGGHQPGQHDRHRPRPGQRRAHQQRPRRPPTQGQVGEPYRYYHDALAAQEQSADDVDTVPAKRAGLPAAAQARRHPATADRSPSGRVLAPPGNVGARPPASGQRDWLILGIGVLAADPWRWPADWSRPPSAPAAGSGPGRRPESSSSPRCPMGLPRPPGSPIGSPPTTPVRGVRGP